MNDYHLKSSAGSVEIRSKFHEVKKLTSKQKSLILFQEWMNPSAVTSVKLWNLLKNFMNMMNNAVWFV